MQRMTLVLTTCAVTAAIAGCTPSLPPAPLEVGNAVPPFKLRSAKDNSTVSSDSFKGQIVVVNFWSTTCSNCLQEIDELQKIHASGKAKVVGIAVDDDIDSVRKLVHKREIQYPVLQGGPAVFERYNGYAVPYTLVLDRRLVVLKKISGRLTTADFDELLKTIPDADKVAVVE